MEWITLCAYLLGLALIPRILLQKKRPASALAWIWAVLLFPFVGPLVYLLLGTERIRRRRLRRRKQFHAPREREGRAAHAWGDRPAQQLLGVIGKINNLPPTADNSVELLLNGEQFYPALVRAIEGARHHVHLIFYIWRNDDVSRQLLEALERAARRGVEVRLLLDEIGSWRTPGKLFKPLRDAGGQFAWFLTLVPQRKLLIMNLRNHRKLAVIDGQQAFVGGMNIGDEYLRKGPRLPIWLDAQLAVRGPVVLQLQEIFAADWHFATRRKLVAHNYYPQPELSSNGKVVQLIAGGPDNSIDEVHLTLVHLINNAQKQIRIVTPYFVPDQVLVDTLRLAAMRGVEIKLLIPSKSDHPWLQQISRSFYEELLGAGVRIFEFKPGFLHAKIMTIDSRWAMVGSANIDIRSFRLNFELNALVASKYLAQVLEGCVDEHLHRSKELHLEQVRTRTRSQRLLEAFLRLFAPVS